MCDRQADRGRRVEPPRQRHSHRGARHHDRQGVEIQAEEARYEAVRGRFGGRGAGQPDAAVERAQQEGPRAAGRIREAGGRLPAGGVQDVIDQPRGGVVLAHRVAYGGGHHRLGEAAEGVGLGVDSGRHRGPVQHVGEVDKSPGQGLIRGGQPPREDRGRAHLADPCGVEQPAIHQGGEALCGGAFGAQQLGARRLQLQGSHDVRGGGEGGVEREEQGLQVRGVRARVVVSERGERGGEAVAAAA